MNDQELKTGDWVEVPKSRHHRWKTNQGKITIIKPPFCMVRVNYHGRSYNVAYRICDVKKI